MCRWSEILTNVPSFSVLHYFMKCASQGYQILTEDGMVASFTVVTVSLTVWLQLVYTLHCASLFICSAHTVCRNTTRSNSHPPWNWWFCWNSAMSKTLWASYTCHNKCDVSEGDFHNHYQNLMVACCSSCYIANFNGEYCAEILVFACTPHDVGHGCLNIQLYTVQAPHINISGNFLAVCTFLLTRKIDNSSYGLIFHTINYSVIIKRFFITKFSNSLKQFFNFGFQFNESIV
jgi:hypothetical protein